MALPEGRTDLRTFVACVPFGLKTFRSVERGPSTGSLALVIGRRSWSDLRTESRPVLSVLAVSVVSAPEKAHASPVHRSLPDLRNGAPASWRSPGVGSPYDAASVALAKKVDGMACCSSQVMAMGRSPT